MDRRHKTGFQTTVQWVKEFCLCTYQHGYKYIVLPGLPTIDRILWYLVLIIGTCTAVWMVWLEWGTNDTNPTLVALDTSHYPIWNFDFPAVTICGINRIRRSKAFNLSREWELPSDISAEDVFHDLLLLSQLIDMNTSNSFKLNRLQSILDLNNMTAGEALEKVMLPCEDLVIKCKFKGQPATCSNIFKPLKTPHGICCSFNYHGTKIEDFEPTLSPSGMRDPYMSRRTSACGYQMGLTILIDNHMDEYYDTLLASYGVKVLLHNPFDYPNDNTDERIVGPGSVMMVSVYPEKYQTTSAVTDISSQERSCLLKNERTLKNLRSYTYSNCVVECRHNYSLQLCGCSPFFYPNHEEEYRTCNLTDVPCFNNHKFELLELGQDFIYNTDFEHIPDGNETNHPPCNCLPECSDLFYRIETSEGYLERDKAQNSIKFYEDVELGQDHSVVHVYFIDLVGTRYMRNLYHTWHQLLASIGGILSLFLGFSIISALEIVYFFTIRVLCTFIIRSSVHPEETRQSIVKSTTPVSPSEYFYSSRGKEIAQLRDENKNNEEFHKFSDRRIYVSSLKLYDK